VLHWAFSPHLHIHFYYIVISKEAVFCGFVIVFSPRMDKQPF
jgi:hypothetical protein